MLRMRLQLGLHPDPLRKLTAIPYEVWTLQLVGIPSP